MEVQKGATEIETKKLNLRFVSQALPGTQPFFETL